MKHTNIFNLRETMRRITVIILILIISCMNSSCTNNKQKPKQERENEVLIDPEAALIKERWSLGGIGITVIDHKGHDFIITSAGGYPGVSVDGEHFPEICEKCRKEKGLD